MIVFRPFVGEVLTGKIAGSSTEGVRVSMGFFDDIIIPPSLIRSGCV
jgi:DNA-directed RNA polymerase III subunit RPC8